MYDWKDRQDRVDYLLEGLRKLPPEKVVVDGPLVVKTAAEAVTEIEAGTEWARGFVSVAGIVLYAIAAERRRVSA